MLGGNPILEVMAPSMPNINDCSIFDYLSTLRAYNSLYMQDYFKQFFIFSFLIKMSMVKAKAIETAFFHSLGNPTEVLHVDYFFCA